MTYEIIKGSSKFIMGISSVTQLSDWLSTNPNITGLAFAGRSNVGKSSIINTLFGKGTARTSKTPGRTREINIFSFKIGENNKSDESFETFYLFDLPGYGFASVSRNISKNWEELIPAFFEGVSKGVTMVNLQDARHPGQKADFKFQDFLKMFNLNTLLIFNKLDKLKTQKERSQLNKLKPTIYKDNKNVKEIHFVSAEKKDGIDPLHNSLISLLINSNNINSQGE